MEPKAFLNLVKRIFLYHHLIYFSLNKFDDLINSQKEFFHKFKILSLDLGYKNLSNIHIPENDDTIFRIFLIFIITMSLFAILNFSFMQCVSGFMSIFIGFVYYNPFLKYNEMLAQNIIFNLVNMYNYLPSMQLILYISTGFAMIGQSLRNVELLYYLFDCCFCGECEESEKKRNKRKCKINLEFEIDVNGSSNNSSFVNM